MFAEVSFPLNVHARLKLEKACAGWLQRRYGLKAGEWWYSTIKPRLIFLERKLNLSEDAPSEFKFITIKGKLTHSHAYLPKHPRVGTTVYDRNLQFLDIKVKGRPNPSFSLPRRITDLCWVFEAAGTGLLRLGHSFHLTNSPRDTSLDDVGKPFRLADGERDEKPC